jgi:rubredoxin
MKTKALISAILLFSATMASAQGTYNYGANVQGIIDGETLTISGSGDMYIFQQGHAPRLVDVKTLIIEEGVTNIGTYAFYQCSGFTSVTIPNSVTSIGEGAFRECSSLTSVTISNLVTSIGDYAFQGCSSLTSATIPKSVKSIGRSAFAGCIDLTSVTIPNLVTNISYGAFGGCIGLTSVTISNSVTSIGDYAFFFCKGLTSICYEGNSEPTCLSNTFTNVEKTIPVCVPADYSSDSWCGFTNLIKGHNKVTDAAVAATCTETGLTEGSHCSYCGKVLVAQEVIPASHTYSHTVVDPTCTAVGYTTHTCSVCNYTYNSDTVDAKGHSYSSTVTAPTCTAVGFTTHTCSVCENTYNSDTVAAKGHKADSVEFENIIPATCTAAGSKDSVVFCSVCQVELSREEHVIPALGHTYGTAITAPTCTAVGYTTHTCSVCEYTYNSDTVDAKGHKADSVEFENIIPATCTAAGSKDSVVFCSVCEVELSREERAIPALGHTEVTDAAVPATCTAAGKTEGKHCSVCNETILAQAEIPALGHEFKEYIYNNDATTTADGTETATCERGCGATDTRTAAGTKLAETPEKGTAVAESAANAVTIYAHHNIIVVENATYEISVYDAMGKLICRDATPCVRTEINVNAPGVYIVKVGGTAKRVMVN